MLSSFPTVFVRLTIATMELVTPHQSAQLWVELPQEHVPSHLECVVCSVLAVESQPPTTTPMPSSPLMQHPQILIHAHTKSASSPVMCAK